MTAHKTAPNRPRPSLDGCIELSGDFVAFTERWRLLTAKTPAETGPKKVSGPVKAKTTNWKKRA